MRGSGGIAAPFLTSAQDGDGEFNALGALFQQKSPRYPFDKRLGEPQNRSGHCEDETNFLPLPGIYLPIPQASIP
jgi:hypothetical protein